MKSPIVFHLTRWGSAFLAAIVPQLANAQISIEAQKRGLDAIADFAERMCAKIPLTGSSATVEFSGHAKAELSKLLKKLADAGIGGAAKYQTVEYENVLQKDLLHAVRMSQDCRITIFKDLNSKLIPSPRAEPPGPLPQPRVPSRSRSCAPQWQTCVGFENLAGLWRGKIPHGPILSVVVELQGGADVYASLAIEKQKCQATLKLSYVNDNMLTTSEFFFKPVRVTSACPSIESIVLTPSPTTSWFNLNKPDGNQLTFVINKKI